MTVAGEVQPVTGDIHRMTVGEYLHVIDVLDWDRIELIEGVVYDVAPVYAGEARIRMDLLRRLDHAFPADMVRNVGTVELGPMSLFDPAAYVFDGRFVPDPDWFLPAAALKLAVELLVTSPRRTLEPKLTAYATAGVPEVWLIDPRPESGELLRHRDPDGSTYRTIDRFDVGEGARDLDVSMILGS